MKKIGAFTLVELIVVITILAILATIGFVSFIGYQKSARESTRLSDVKLIEKQLSIYEVRNNTIPLPDNAVTITASGTTIGYQGEVGTGVLVAIRQAGDIKDPLDDSRYSFFVDASRLNYQIMAMMEKEESLRTSFTPETYANVDYTERYPRMFGLPLGILTDLDKTPLEKIPGVTTLDIINYSGTGYTAHYSDTESITGTGQVLHELIQNASCKRIKQLTSVQNGVYTINPKGSGEIEVYCEMNIDGGAWTLVARTHPNSFGNTDFGWLQSTGSAGDNSTAYSLGAAIKNIEFDQFLFTAYLTDKEIAAAVRLDIDKDFFQTQINSTPQSDLDGDDLIYNTADDQVSRTENCTEVMSSTIPLFDAECDTGGYRYWGAFGRDDRYVFNRQPYSESGLIYAHIIDTGNNGFPKDLDMISSGGDPSFDNFRKEQGMLFVR